MCAIQLQIENRKLYRFFLLEADNGTNGKGETIWPSDPDAYDGTSLYEKFEAYVPFTNEEIYPNPPPQAQGCPGNGLK